MHRWLIVRTFITMLGLAVPLAASGQTLPNSPGAASAATNAGSEIEVVGECISVAALRTRLATLRERPDGTQLSVRVACGNPIHAWLRVRRGAHEIRRDLEIPSESQSSVVATLAFVTEVALGTLDQRSAANSMRQHTIPHLRPSAAMRATPDGRVGREPGSANSGSANSNEAHSETDNGPKSSRRRDVAIGPTLLGGLLPSAAAGAEILLGLGPVDLLSVELSVSAVGATPTMVREGQVTLTPLNAQFAGCVLPRIGRLKLGVCAGISAGLLFSRGEQFNIRDGRRVDGWLSAQVRPRVRLGFGPVFVQLDAIAGAVFWGPQIQVRTARDGTTAFVLGPWFGGVAILLGFHFDGASRSAGSPTR